MREQMNEKGNFFGFSESGNVWEIFNHVLAMGENEQHSAVLLLKKADLVYSRRNALCQSRRR